MVLDLVDADGFRRIRPPAARREHAVEHRRVQMDVEIERPAEALHDNNRAAPADSRARLRKNPNTARTNSRVTACSGGARSRPPATRS
jgi:hypothetical protein